MESNRDLYFLPGYLDGSENLEKGITPLYGGRQPIEVLLRHVTWFFLITVIVPEIRYDTVNNWGNETLNFNNFLT